MCTKGICPHIYLKMYALGIVIGRGADLDMYPLPSCSSFHANYHWAASSYLTIGNIHSCCFSMGSFISSHTNKCTNMHVLTHNHTFSFCPMFCPHFFRVTTHNTQYNTWNEIHHRMKTRKDKKKKKNSQQVLVILSASTILNTCPSWHRWSSLKRPRYSAVAISSGAQFPH